MKPHGQFSDQITAETIREALRCGEPGCSCGTPRGHVHCPAHDPDRTDQTPSLSLSENGGKILVHCFNGCSQEAVITALRERDLWFKEGGKTTGKRWNRGTSKGKPAKDAGFGGSTTGSTPKLQNGTGTGLTLQQLVEAKKLPLEFLRGLGLADQKFKGSPRVVIPYMNEVGEVAAVRYRLSLDGPPRFIWRKGDRVLLYGLWRLAEIRRAGWCLLVEGESDCWTAWLPGLPALGIPGKSIFRPEWALLLEGVRVFLWQEPDAPELPLKIGKDLPGLMVVSAPDGFKDLSEAHCHGQDMAALVERLKAQAIPASTLIREEQDARLKELREAASPVLAHPDPLALVQEQVGPLGYGGNPAPVIICYLALTSRLLVLRRGSMLVHLLLISQSSAGKNYTLGTATCLMPAEAVHSINAGSPRVLIYDEADLQHRAVIFGEADSLPAGEDNPAASAIRNLLQDGCLHYEVVVRDPDTGQYIVKKVSKPGPTVLITTSTRRLGHQMDTRIFSLEVPDDPGQIRAALEAQASQEILGAQEPDAALVAFQAYLQALAPWRVVVPFAPDLAREIGKQAMAPRILRDFPRLISLVKAVAVLRHQHRDRDTKGRIIATLEDYETVYHLVAPMYETTVTGASQDIRAVVAAVPELGEGVTTAAVARHLEVPKNTAWRRVQIALKQGWLVNTQTIKNRPAVLELGDPLPDRDGLPRPERFQRFQGGTGGGTGSGTAQGVDNAEEMGDGSTVPGDTDSSFPPTHEDDNVQMPLKEFSL
jgi:hypothetical protein